MHRCSHPALYRIASLLLSLIILTGSAFSRLAQAGGIGPEIVKDIQTMNSSSLPIWFTAAGDSFFFFANDELHGNELWRSRGTDETTVMVADLVPGSEGINPTAMTQLDDTRVIFSDKGASRIWVSDGTLGGTKMLAEHTGGYYSTSQVTASADGLVYLIYKSELWRTDGTPGGTVQVTTMPLASNTLAAFNGWLYYAAQGPQGAELYRTSRAAAAPELVVDMCPSDGDCGAGPGNGNPTELIAGSDRLYFAANDPVNGRALWSITGTDEKSLTLVADLIPGPGSAEGYGRLKPAGSGVYFTGNDGIYGKELWYSAGTDETAHLVADMYPGADGTTISEMYVFGSTLFFTARPEAGPATSFILYKTNGSGVTTVFSTPMSAGMFTEMGGALYAVGYGATEDALFKLTADGAPQQLVIIKRPPTYPQNMIAWKGRLFFSAGDPLSGYEPWTSDGSGAGTRIMADLNIQENKNGANIESLSVIYNGSVFFNAGSGFNYSMMWRTDGTADGTRPVHTFSGNLPEIKDAAAFNDLLYFSTGYNGLWRTDGTAEGTLRVPVDGFPRRLMEANGKLFFIANARDGNSTTALWVMNKGDTAPAQLTVPDSTELQAGVLGRYYLFTAWKPGGWALWRSDGTPQNTKVIYTGTTSAVGYQDYDTNYLQAMFPFDGRLFFAAPAKDGSSAFTLYATDGVTVKQISAAEGMPLFPTQPVVAGDVLYFGGANQKGVDVTDTVIWKVTKGATQAEVVYISAKAVEMLSMDTIPLPLTSLNGSLVFNLGRQQDSRLLWMSDGTPGGSAPICPGCGYRADQVPQPVVYGGKMYFSAQDSAGKQGRELWVSDGTNTGTNLLADILPGPDSSNPSSLFCLGDQLLFTASDGTTPGVGHGRELWHYTLDSTVTRFYDTYLPVIRH